MKMIDNNQEETPTGEVGFSEGFAEISHHKKRAFLLAYSLSGSIQEACNAAGIDRQLHYYWLKHDSVYAQAYEEADQRFGDVLEAEARRRALKSSDLLLIFTLKAEKPHKYKESYDVTSGGKPLEPTRVEVVYEVQPAGNEP